MLMYKFSLIGDCEFMSTDVDAPNPQIDAEFWARFMEGDCLMEFVGSYEEDEDD